MSSTQNHMTSAEEVTNLCRRQVPPRKIEQLRNRPERCPAEKCRENHAVAEELKKQIGVLNAIRKSDNLDSRLKKIEDAVTTLRDQSKPLKKSLNSTLFSTDTLLLELVAQSTRETLMEIGGSTMIDPVDAGKRVGAALEQARNSMKHYKPDKSEWCAEWELDEEEDNLDDLYNDIYFDASVYDTLRFASRLSFLHRHYRELVLFSRPEPAAKTSKAEKTSAALTFEPAVFPFNADLEFVLQLVDVEPVEKPKKVREKVERDSKKKVTAELVKVNDKASNVQSEEVSISNELNHVLKIFKKELKTRNTDGISYYEFVTNPESFSRTVENMFYVSYLMRDREVFLVEVKGIPTLKRPASKDENGKKHLTEQCSWHGVTSLSYEQWVRLSKVFRTSIIKPLEG